MDSETPGQTNIDIPAAPAPLAGSSNPAQKTDAEQDKRRIDILRTKIAKCKKIKRSLVPLWTKNVDYRRGKPFETSSDQDRIQVAADWARTKAKQAQLFSQVPEVRMTPRQKEFGPGALIFGKRLNEVLSNAKVGISMDECLPDVINASGVAAVHVSFEQRNIEVQDVEAIEPAAGEAEPKPTTPYTTAYRFNIDHISPADLIWDVSWVGSDFNRCPVVGFEGRMHWFDAKKEFGLSDRDYQDCVGGDTRNSYETLKGDVDPSERDTEDDLVEYTQLFYYRHLYHDDELSFETIQRVVFVKGKAKPVIDEPWKGQQVVMDGNDPIIAGSCLRPVQFLTLTYVSGENIPPSDSAMGRPQVDELIRARSQMIRNRENSVPMRWANVNLLDPNILPLVLRGTWQGIIPVNGDGQKVVGEVARAAYPREDFEFANIANRDLDETWQTGPGDGGGSATQIRSASEAQIRQSNFQTRIGYERARVVDFFLRIAQVTAGLMQLYYPWSDNEEQALGPILQAHVPTYYAFEVRADSTVLLDASQRLERLTQYLNLMGKSGVVDVPRIAAEIAALIGLDESIVAPPPQKGPEPINISLRIDEQSMHDPMVVAMLIRTGQMPNPQEIEQAKAAILAASMPAGSVGPDGSPLPPGAGPAGPPMGAAGATAPGPGAGGMLGTNMAPTETMHPDWTELDRINKRTHDGK